MAVVIKYIVERNGVEKKTFTSKKEADAYDKLLDIADELGDWLGGLEVELSDAQCEELGYQLALHRDTLQLLLKGNVPQRAAGKTRAQPKSGDGNLTSPSSKSAA